MKKQQITIIWNFLLIFETSLAAEDTPDSETKNISETKLCSSVILDKLKVCLSFIYSFQFRIGSTSTKYILPNYAGYEKLQQVYSFLYKSSFGNC